MNWCIIFYVEVGKFKWLKCPSCDKPLLRITDKSLVINDVFCRCCKSYYYTEIINGEIRTVKKSA